MHDEVTQAETDRLLGLAMAGESRAIQTLFDHHRSRLKRLIQLRMDRRIATRIDPSDVVQEALLTAFGRINEYVRDRPIAFYPWLRRIALERLLDLRRRHVTSSRRTVDRELGQHADDSQRQLVEHFANSETGPLQKLARRELHDRVKNALQQLSPSDREILVLRMLEQMSVREASDVLEISEDAVKQRQLRALRRLRRLLDGGSGDLS